MQFAPGTKTFDRFVALFDLLEERLGRRVELVTTEALSPFIGPRILADAEDELVWDVVKNRIPNLRRQIGSILGA